MDREPAEHTPVLLNEILAALEPALSPREDGVIVDCTFGRGGHTRALLARLGKRGRLLALDRDPQAVQAARAQIDDDRFSIYHAAFSQLPQVLQQANTPRVDALLMDLGVSSPQLDEAARGFSFMRDGDLDMRMDTTQGTPASGWIAHADAAELAVVFKTYGEERYAKRIARAIVSARAAQAITRTKQLAEIVAAAHPAWQRGQHPATRVFQAIRIHINRELDELRAVLQHALAALARGGRLAVISFHSLEDRMVKQFFRQQAQGETAPPDLPLRAAQLRGGKLHRVGKAMHPSAAEIEANPRARSAVLRVAECSA